MEHTVIFESSKPGIVSRRFAFKVTMRAGRLTRERWVKNRVFPGKLVKDKDGRIFRVVAVKLSQAPGIQLTTLETIGDDDADLRLRMSNGTQDGISEAEAG